MSNVLVACYKPGNGHCLLGNMQFCFLNWATDLWDDLPVPSVLEWEDFPGGLYGRLELGPLQFVWLAW